MSKPKVMSNPNVPNNSAIQLQLGDIIEIVAPSDPDIHHHIYFINFIDKEKIVLLEEDGTKRVFQMNETGNLRNEAITNIDILARVEERGYARQNKLITGAWVDIYFNGDVPVVITGKITNLEEDMIELTTFPEKEIIYINFDYKGLPEDIPIEKIILREIPLTLMPGSALPGSALPGSALPGSALPGSALPGSEQAEQQQALFEELGTDDYDDYNINENVDENVYENVDMKNLIFKADQIIFGEKLDTITQEISVSDTEHRFGIENQIQDLLDDLLSTIPNTQRTKTVMNSIQKMIERFKQLRATFSTFDAYGNALMPHIQGAEYKPLVEILQNFSQKLYWVLPVVRNKKKLYDTEQDQDNEDSLLLSMNETLQEEIDQINTYMEGSVPTGENKYDFLVKSLNAYLTPFGEPNYMENNLINTKVNTNLTAVVYNFEADNKGFYSSAAKHVMKKSEDESYIFKKRFLMQDYNTGMNGLEITKIKGGNDVITRKKITENDSLSLKSILTLPEVTVRFSRVNLPATNIMLKSNLNMSYIKYWNFLNRKTPVTTTIISNIEKPLDYEKEHFVKNVKEYILDETITDENKYKKYLETIIPKTRILFNLVKSYITGKLSVYEVLSYLEPFMIYQKDLSFMQYKEITEFIQLQITDFKKKYIEKSRLFGTINAKKSELTINPFFSILKQFNDEIFETYELNPTMSVLDFLLTINKIDGGNFFNSAVSWLSLDLMIYNSEENKGLIETFIKETKEKNANQENVNQENVNQENVNQTCTKIKKIAKRYIELDELTDDNGKDIYFDKKYDTTFYSIMDEYREKITPKMSPADQEKLVSEKLMKTNGLNKEEALREARAMLLGKRKVENGDIAIRELLENEEISLFYYQRVNNEWLPLPEDVANEIFVDTRSKSICNLAPTCLANKKGKCTEAEIISTELKNKNLEQMLKEFDTTLGANKDAIKETLLADLLNYKKRIGIILRLNKNRAHKYDIQKYALGNTAEEVVTLVSPYVRLRDQILEQGDFVKRQIDLSKFILNYTRTPTDAEDVHWLYCNITQTKLLPTFLAKLAKAFIDGKYRTVLKQICSEQGTISEDGDVWVDKKGSGLTICAIDFSDADEYTEEGFKSITHAVLEADLGEEYLIEGKTKPKETKKPEFENPDAIKVRKVIDAMSGYLGINLETKKEFIIRNVLKQLENKKITLSKDAYEKFMATAKTTKSAPETYEVYYNGVLLITTLSFYLIAIQISMPDIKTRKTFPGCVKSFAGFPLGGIEDKTGLNYIACVASKLEKRSVEVWSTLASLKEKQLVSKMETTINIILKENEEVKEELAKKQKYLVLNKDKQDIPDDHNISNWVNFLPPLRSFKMATIQNITDHFEKELKDSLRKGEIKQREMLSIIRSKIIFYSFAIQELIQNTVHKKTAILMNANSEPFLENACCDKSEINTFKYFLKEQPEIGNATAAVLRLGQILDDVQRIGKAGMLLDPRDTKRKFIVLPTEFSEETVYRAFIVLCKYNSSIPISKELSEICMNKPENFNANDSLEESIRKLKRDGKNFNSESLQQLLTIVNRNNMVNFEFNKIAKNNSNVLRDILTALPPNTFPTPFKEKFLDVLALGPGLEESNSVLRDFRAYLGKENISMKETINAFIGKEDKKSIKEFLENIEKITEFKETGNNVFIEREDETINKMLDFIKNAARDITRVFPNMILNKINYTNVVIPAHWKLSKKHNNDLKVNYKSHYELLYKLYEDSDIKLVMEEILRVTNNMEELITNTLFQVPFKIGDKYMYSLFDRRLCIMLFQYYFYSILMKFIAIKDNAGILNNPGMKTYEDEDDEDDDDEMELGEKKNLSSKLVNILTTFISIINIDKKAIDYNYAAVMERVLRAKEKEKDEITRKFKEMPDDMRAVKDLFKSHKLEEWGKGLQSGLFKYSKDTYDEERDEMDRQTINNMKLVQQNKIDNIDDRNKDLAEDDLMEEEARAAEMDAENDEINRGEYDDEYGGDDNDENAYDMNDNYD